MSIHIYSIYIYIYIIYKRNNTYIYTRTLSTGFIYNEDVPKCLSCRKVILVMTGREHCFRDYICVMSILLLRDWST